MRLSAFGAPYAADPKRIDAIRKKDAPRIVSVDGEAGRVPAGACQPVKLEAVYDGIVIIL